MAIMQSIKRPPPLMNCLLPIQCRNPEARRGKQTLLRSVAIDGLQPNAIAPDKQIVGRGQCPTATLRHLAYVRLTHIQQCCAAESAKPNMALKPIGERHVY